MKKLKFPDGYKNTGIFAEITKEFDTQLKNKQLKEMYQEWLKKIDDNVLANDNTSKYNGIQYLTYSDSYLNKSAKIMIFGREANTQDYKFDNRQDFFDKIYQHDLCYSYEYAIAHPNESYAKDRKNTFYLKTRKLICGFNDDKPDEASICSVLINNLNKTSFMGKFTPCDKDFDNSLYSDFDYNGLKKNVFIHELNILRPTHLIFLCGKGYDNHIIRNFGENFYKEIEILIKDISSKKNPVSGTKTLEPGKVKDLLGIENYGELKILYATHPSAPMKGNIRDEYKSKLEKFIKIQNK